MNTLNKLLDKAAEVCGSDLATAAKLRITRSAVSKWRHGGKITPAQLAKLLELTQQDPALAVQVMQEQDADPAEHRLWSALWDRLSPATSLVVGALLLAGLAVPYPAQAAARTAPDSTLCEMRRRGWRGLVAAFESLLRRTGDMRYAPMPAL